MCQGRNQYSADSTKSITGHHEVCMNNSKNIWLVALTVLAFWTTTSAEDRRTDRSHLTIMTLNAEFLWDGVQPEEGQANFDWKDSQTEAEDHMAKLATII